ncbi:MAG: family 43 glycosylhydrolase [Promethearchaeota archaeon]
MSVDRIKAWKNWTDNDNNPLINPVPPEWIIADPTFLSPNESPDNMWHLFAHGILYGIYHFISHDGIKWKNTEQNMPSGIRPFLFKENNIYYLLYERIFTTFLANIAICKSSDLYKWTKSKYILTPTRSWEGRFSRRVGSPCLVKFDGKYRLYYSGGSVFLWDTMVPEPKYIGVAEAPKILGPYKKKSKPIISPSKNHKYRNVASGAMKVLKLADSWVGFNNGFYKDKNDRNRSSILLLHSTDGLNWNDVFEKPIIFPTTGWKRAFIYQLGIKKIEGNYWLYYNARNRWIRGIEKIGLAVLHL